MSEIKFKIQNTANGGSVAVGGNVGGNITIYNLHSSARPVEVNPQVLAEAQQQMENMLLAETLPRPTLPAGSRIALRANPFFTGRQTELRDLATALKAGQVAAITGWGGVGKTQLAAEFALRYGHYFAGGVFWVSMAQPSNVMTEVAACGAWLKLQADYHALSLTDQVRLTLGAWQSPLPRLLIFDNCESARLLHDCLPPQGGCRVLLTSRKAEWTGLGLVLPLATLPRAESVALLQQFRPDLHTPADHAGLADIAATLGDLPLALHLAGSYLKYYRHDPLGAPAQYLQALHASALLQHPALQGKGAGPSPTQHEQNVSRTFEVSYQQLTLANPIDAAAHAALVHAACFVPGAPFPRPTLKQALQPVAGELPEDALHRLLALGLIMEVGDGTQMLLHRLVAAFAQQVTKGLYTARYRVAQVVAEELEAAWRANQTTEKVRAWGVHLQWLADAVAPRNDKVRCDLYDYAALYLYELGEFQKAATIQQKALELWLETDPTRRSLDYAAAANNLANTLRTLGQYPEAQALLQDALSVYQAEFGAEARDVAVVYDSLGNALCKLGHYAEAVAAHEKALAIDRAALQQDPSAGNASAVAADLLGLGNAQLGLGAAAAAHACYTEMLALIENYGNKSDEASAHGGFARWAIHQGDFATALIEAQKALALDEAVYGPHHLYVAYDLRELAKAQRGLGQLAEARATGQRALAILTATFDAQHPEAQALAQWLAE